MSRGREGRGAAERASILRGEVGPLVCRPRRRRRAMCHPIAEEP